MFADSQQALQVPETPERFVVPLEDALSLNHVAIFMTGQAPFPDGFAASLHLEMPGKGWQLIGSLSNSKPSAIFRLRGTFVPSANAGSFSHPSFSTSQTVATLGILCESTAQVEAQTAQLGLTAASANPAASQALVPSGGGGAASAADPVGLAQRVAKNLFNAISGFAQSYQTIDGRTAYAVDFAAVEKWYSFTHFAMTFTDSINKALFTIAHPRGEATPSVEHPAHLGACSPPKNDDDLGLRRFISPETTAHIKGSGNNGVGMDDGLRAKAIAQQEAVAERSRLRQNGMFESHVKHDKLVSMSPEHREVADGAHINYEFQNGKWVN
ncbi:hypothetical protein OIO90_003749 [Microbotryomycetes sp. JL221]|nr:hypothetical protein OIO90_003749 [Microbotryomycetes sp. JL221]